MEKEKKVKLALISGASHAVKFLQEHPKASGEKAIQHIIDNANKIIEKIDDDE